MTSITRPPSPAAALLAAALAFAAAPASAQHADHGSPAAGPAPAAADAPLTHGEVRKIDLQARKLTLRHGVIQNLDMPPMTMVFQVADPALLDQLAVGDTVRFHAERRQGAIVVTALERKRP